MTNPTKQGIPARSRIQLNQEEFRGHGERVLYVDDEESLVFLIGHWLERLGYRVTGCSRPEKALETFRSGPQDFEVVVCDLCMPEMSGVDLARELLKIRPGMPILITSGHFGPADNEEVRSLGLPDLLLKPNTIEELGQTLHNVFTKCSPSATD